MPELPDVETFKRYLNATSLHQRVAGVGVQSAYVLKGISTRELAHRLKGHCFESSCRHGKHLFVRADGDFWLRLHFGMTGSLRYFKDEGKAPPPASAKASARRHTRVLFVFANNYRLGFDDQRKFGEIGLVKDVDAFLKKRALGPDALDVDLVGFKDTIARHHGAVKSILINQKLIAGIGNIYADEILFHARIHPATESARLNDKKRRQLFRAMRHVLQKAIEYQADVNRMPKSWLLPHRRKGGKCPRCGRGLRSSKIGGRTAWFCPHCQRQAV
jgi:formamidopyrimidine-DNA glycosylase